MYAACLWPQLVTMYVQLISAAAADHDRDRGLYS